MSGVGNPGAWNFRAKCVKISETAAAFFSDDGEYAAVVAFPKGGGKVFEEGKEKGTDFHFVISEFKEPPSGQSSSSAT